MRKETIWKSALLNEFTEHSAALMVDECIAQLSNGDSWVCARAIVIVQRTLQTYQS